MNLYPVLIALFLSSIAFVFLTLVALLSNRWLKIHPASGEPDPSTMPFNFKTIFNSLATSYILEFFLPFVLFVILLDLLPFEGIRFGVLFALLVFILNSLEVFVLSSQGTKLGFDFISHNLFWKLLKYLASFGIAGFLLSLL